MYHQAIEAGAQQDDVRKLERLHARCLLQFQAIQRQVLKEVQRRSESRGQTTVWKAAVEYIDSEDQYKEEKADADAGIEELTRRLDQAKLNYQRSLVALEALSNEIHCRRRVGRR